MHLEAFHQAEVLWVDERSRLDPWQMTGRVLRSVDQALPGRTVKIVPTQYSMCSQAWELEVDEDGQWSEVHRLGRLQRPHRPSSRRRPRTPYRRRRRLWARAHRHAALRHRRCSENRRRQCCVAGTYFST